MDLRASDASVAGQPLKPSKSYVSMVYDFFTQVGSGGHPESSAEAVQNSSQKQQQDQQLGDSGTSWQEYESESGSDSECDGEETEEIEDIGRIINRGPNFPKRVKKRHRGKGTNG